MSKFLVQNVINHLTYAWNRCRCFTLRCELIDKHNAHALFNHIQLYNILNCYIMSNTHILYEYIALRCVLINDDDVNACCEVQAFFNSINSNVECSNKNVIIIKECMMQLWMHYIAMLINVRPLDVINSKVEISR